MLKFYTVHKTLSPNKKLIMGVCSSCNSGESTDDAYSSEIEVNTTCTCCYKCNGSITKQDQDTNNVQSQMHGKIIFHITCPNVTNTYNESIVNHDSTAL